jgi:hypothetical protein
MAASFDWHRGRITLRTPITASYRNTQNVRRFFKSQCGDRFTFDRAFSLVAGRKGKDHGRCRRSMAKAGTPHRELVAEVLADRGLFPCSEIPGRSETVSIALPARSIGLDIYAGHSMYRNVCVQSRRHFGCC